MSRPLSFVRLAPFYLAALGLARVEVEMAALPRVFWPNTHVGRGGRADPQVPETFFEVPIVPPLPEALNYIVP